MATSVEIDWVAKGMVTPVKNQLSCGSCWAFCAVGVLESWAKLKGQTVNLSEQQLVDCTTVSPYGNYGCSGGWPANALNYVKAVGIATTAEYPYKAVNQNCLKNGGSFKISAVYTTASGCPAI
jgi:C1A family cysteine protease